MLARDFIDDSLYNPNYGYFATKVEIFDPDLATNEGSSTGAGASSTNDDQVLAAATRAQGFDFGAFRSTSEFEDEVARRYQVFEGTGSGHATDAGLGSGVGRQVWHTPTELFKPWYGRALARYLVAQYKLDLYPYHDLIIYEIGAGNGTLMGDILDYLAAHEPEVYSRTKYRIIEISERLQGMQRGRASGVAASDHTGGGDDGAGRLGKEKAKRRGHEDRVEIVNSSIFEWDRVVPEPCFFLAMEVLDNLSHDVVRYTTDTYEPLQCVVSVDASGDYTELYEPVSDPLLARYLSLRARLPSSRARSHPSRAIPSLLAKFPILRSLYATIPFAPNLTQPEFVPTRQLELLEILRDKFPNHRLLMSDFETLPDAIEGVNAPVVQTRYAGETVPCTTYLVQPGFFDIFFPTDFHAMAELYSLVMASESSNSTPSASLGGDDNLGYFSRSTALARGRTGTDSTAADVRRRALEVIDHAEFLEEWAEIDMTRTQDGTNPMVDSYQNAKFIC
ncbi:hypothetical protein JCM10908_001350 [Rhodotorula pacifica]|uniref:type II protein arginine methyltransferase n=1 Tax=Rhodotorula pacifica TaxID=1495444 RepID=UPI003180A035